MSYQVLARKYRPKNFQQLIGQQHVSTALSHALEKNRVHHAYLFTGTRGVGKTTIARILAKCLNCETGVTAVPCEVCQHCQSINQGRFIDLIEIDAASNTKVEDMRELLENVPYAPSQGRYKVYLIDEVHMLSTHSFNALLKTLEEPPEHVKFILATTDPKKLPITIISRCLQFVLRPLTQVEIKQHLADVLSTEKIDFELEALWMLAESAQGSLRDALSLTDQAIAYGQGQLMQQQVEQMLGRLDRSIIFKLLDAIVSNQPQQIAQLLHNLRQQSVDLMSILDQIISVLHDVALAQLVPIDQADFSPQHLQQIQQLTAIINASDVQLYYQIALKGMDDMRISPNLQHGFDMVILRMLAFRPLTIQTIASEVTNNNNIEKPSIAHNNNPETLLSKQNHQQSAALEPNQLDSNQQITLSKSSPVESEHSSNSPVDAEHSSNIDYRDQNLAISGHAESNHVDDAQAQDTDSDRSKAEPVLSPNQAVLAKVVSSSQAVSSTAELSSSTPYTDSLDVEKPVLEKPVLDKSFLESPAIAEPIRENQPSDQMSEADFSQQNSDAEHKTSLNKDLALSAKFDPEQTSGDNDHPTGIIAQPNQLEQSTTESAQTPQQLLLVPELELSGEWSIEKWEAWFRFAKLPPAAEELAQHALVSGNIAELLVLNFERQREILVNQLLEQLKERLNEKWPNMQIKIDYVETIEQPTAFDLQQKRKQNALQRAESLFHRIPAVQQFIADFDAELTEIKLK